MPEKEQIIPKVAVKTDAYAPEKKLTQESLKSLAALLDTDGQSYDKSVDEILKKPQIKR